MKATAQVHNMPNQPQNFEDVMQAEVDRQEAAAEKQNVEDIETEKMSDKKKYEEFLRKPPVEILEDYETNISDIEWRDFVKRLEDILERREQCTLEMKALSEWCAEKKLDFPSIKHMHKRAIKPVKKQNLVDASLAYAGKKFDSGFQPGLFGDDED